MAKTTVKHIIVSGGSYAPVHKGHLNNWISAINRYYKQMQMIDLDLKINEILLLIIPVSDFSLKDSIQSVVYTNRIRLIELLLKNINNNYNIKIDKFHQNKKKIIFTHEEVEYVTRKYNIQPLVLFGADNIIGAIGKGWHLAPDKLRELFHKNTFICSCSCDKFDVRGHCEEFEKKFDKVMKKHNIDSNLIIFKIKQSDSMISSTLIRDLLIKDKIKEISNYMFKNQIEYMLDNNLWL
jgi:nicotinic acid mononucleotide adenylyltransferase